MAIPKFSTDREERINYDRLRSYRLNRTKEMMKKHGIDCLVTWEAWDIRYVSGVYVTIPTRWIEGQLAILPINGDPYVYGSTCFSPYRMAEKMPWLKNKVWAMLPMVKQLTTKAEFKPITDAIGKIMADHGLSKGVLGVDGTQSEWLLGDVLKDAGIKYKDAKEAMFEARMIKNQDEIELVRMACANAEAAFADIQAAIRPGITETEIVGLGMNKLYALGADETMEFVCSSGERTNPLYIDYTDRQVRPHDLVIVDINGNSYQGYKSCYYRTFSCGKPNQEQNEIFEECRRMLWDAIGVVKPGNTTWDVAQKWPDSPRHWGYELWPDVFALAIGHGVGISLHEFPWIGHELSRVKPVKLQEGMVIALETWYGIKGHKDGVRLEDMVAVTRDGYDLLTEWPVDKLTECWI